VARDSDKPPHPIVTAVALVTAIAVLIGASTSYLIGILVWVFCAAVALVAFLFIRRSGVSKPGSGPWMIAFVTVAFLGGATAFLWTLVGPSALILVGIVVALGIAGVALSRHRPPHHEPDAAPPVPAPSRETTTVFSIAFPATHRVVIDGIVAGLGPERAYRICAEVAEEMHLAAGAASFSASTFDEAVAAVRRRDEASPRGGNYRHTTVDLHSRDDPAGLAVCSIVLTTLAASPEISTTTRASARSALLAQLVPIEPERTRSIALVWTPESLGRSYDAVGLAAAFPELTPYEPET
jgi:hypothetical protein